VTAKVLGLLGSPLRQLHQIDTLGLGHLVAHRLPPKMTVSFVFRYACLGEDAGALEAPAVSWAFDDVTSVITNPRRKPGCAQIRASFPNVAGRAPFARLPTEGIILAVVVSVVVQNADKLP
jgi:hypothetical protein